MRSYLVVCLLLVAATAPAAAPSRFEIRRLGVDGEVLAVVPADLDGDRHADLLVAYKKGRRPGEQRFFGVFWNRGGNFGDHPDLVFPADAETVVFDVADIDDHAGAELLVVSRSGVAAISFRARAAGAARALTTDATLFYRPEPGALPRLRLVHDLSGKGSHELLVPMLGALGVYKRSGDGFVSAARLDLDMTSDVATGFRPSRAATVLGGFNATFAFPSVHVADTDGDAIPDLLFASDDRV